MRLLKELFNSKAKCERVGHKMRSYERQVYFYPSEFRFRCIADSATEVVHYCARCQEKFDIEVKNRTGLNGLTMSTPDWDKLKAEGVLR